MTEKQSKILSEEELKELLFFINSSINDYGNIDPIFYIGLLKEGKKIKALAPVPSEFMKNNSTKNIIVEHMLPQISEKIKEDNLIFEYIIFISEAWVRGGDKEQLKNVEDLHSLPITSEIIMINIESFEHKEMITYEIIRNGKVVNSKGDMIDNVTLERNEILENGHITGRFTNLAQIFK